MSDWQFLEALAEVVAPRLLGCHLVREFNGQKLIGKIVEVEAYDQSDAASHSYRGKTARTEVMFGPPGYAYVYFTYGMHFCMNIVVGSAGYGSAVLIRALEPVAGEEIMSHNRGKKTGNELTNGPAKLCQALAIDKGLNGHNLRERPLRLIVNPAISPENITKTTRIGISRAQDALLRFYIKNSDYVPHP